MKAFKAIIILLFFITPAFTQEEVSESKEGLSMIKGVVYSASENIVLEGVELINLKTGEKFYSTEEGSFEIPVGNSSLWVGLYYPGFSDKVLLLDDSKSWIIFMYKPDERTSDSKMKGYFGDHFKFNNASTEFLRTGNILSESNNSLESLVQGKFSGLSAGMISGMPGEGGILSIRGISTLFSNSSPLILLDGMPFNSGILESGTSDGNFYNPLKNIDAYDIESIEVIKDGGSLYGMRGGNGVILINTRQPEGVTTKINFSLNSGITFEPEYLRLLNTSEHKTYLMNQFQNSGLSSNEIAEQNPWITGNPSYYYYYNYNNNTDWQREIFSPANMNKFNVSLRGGDEIAKFSIMVGYLNQAGIIDNTNYQRYNFRLNSDIRIIEKLYFRSNVGFTYNISDLKNAGTDYTLNPITSSLLKSPMFGPNLRDNEGNIISILGNSDNYGFSNPAALINKMNSEAYESGLFTNLKLSYEALNNLTLNNIINVSFNNIKENTFIPDYGIPDFNSGENRNKATEGLYKSFAISNETNLDYFKDSDMIHFYHVQAGLRINTSSQIYNQGTVYNTPTDEFKSLSSVSIVQNTLVNGFNQRINYSDFFLKGGYRYLDKYMADVVLNLSASSNTGKNADGIDLFGGIWGFFPSVHLAWILSSESFLSDASSLDLLKLRASYTTTGNDSYNMNSRYIYSSRTYGTNSGIVRSFIPNESLKWETIRQMNLGTDMAFYREKVRFSIDAWSRNTTDLLSYIDMPAISGFESYWNNSGSLKSKGIDLNLELKPLTGSFEILIGGNLGLNKNTVEIDQDIILDIAGGQVIIQNGSTAFAFYGLESNGIYQTAAEAANSGLSNAGGLPYQGGDMVFVNQDANSIIDENDRVELGNLLPTINAGAYLSLKFKRFRSYILFDYSGGNQIFNYTRMQLESFSGYANQSQAALYAWKNDHSTTDIPRIAYGDPAGNSQFSDRWIENGNFFRLKEISLSYTLPKTEVYENLKIYLTGRNLLSFSNYLGYYPEFAYSSAISDRGADYGQMPVTPQIVAGVNISF